LLIPPAVIVHVPPAAYSITVIERDGVKQGELGDVDGSPTQLIAILEGTGLPGQTMTLGEASMRSTCSTT